MLMELRGRARAVCSNRTFSEASPAFAQPTKANSPQLQRCGLLGKKLIL